MTDEFKRDGIGGLRHQRLVQSEPWCLTHRKDLLEISYNGETISSQYCALHLNDGYLRLVYGPASSWGTSAILMPVFWSHGQLFQGAPISCTPSVEGSDLILHLEGEIADLRVSSDVRMSPPDGDSISAAITTRLKGKVQLDSRPAEAMKLVMLSSMHVSPGIWDSQIAYVQSQPHPIPKQGWIIQPPVVADQFSLRGGSSEWKENAPTILIELDRHATIAGWVTLSEDPNDDNVGLWAAADEFLPAWSYKLRAMRERREPLAPVALKSMVPDERIYLNGISGANRGYLVEPFSLVDLRDRARELRKSERFSSEDHLSALKTKGDPAGAAYPIPADASPEKLQTTGWGMIFPAEADPNHVEVILEALSELVVLRQEQAGERFHIFKGGAGYRPGETADGFVVRQGGQPGTPDVNKVPYYLLIVADPESIPFHFQYELDVQFGVGRIYFETASEYANYARSVLLSETPGEVRLSPEAVFFGVANTADPATHLSAESLIAPLYKYTLDKHVELGWNQPTLVQPADATKNNLARFLGGNQTPALLFSASHGLGWPYDHAYQYPFQGALVTQDWPGPSVTTAPTRDMYFGAEDLDSQANLLGSIAFFFACFGGGTPYWDDYAVARNRQREALARRAFMAALPLRMLSHPRGGALAVIAHVERAWGYSFKWQGSAGAPTSFQNVLYLLMKGVPVGYATEHLNLRYAQFATMLSSNFEDAKYEPGFNPLTIGTNWLATNDARGYAVIGDPAVRIPVLRQGTTPSRPAIDLPKQRVATLPVVLGGDSTPASEQPSQRPTQAPIHELGPRSAPAGAGAVPYASAVDGLAFALQAYTGEAPVSFAIGGEGGVEFSIRDDAKKLISDVVVNLNSALQNLSRRLLDATSQALTLNVTTSLVDNLDTYDPFKPDVQKAVARFKTAISATGDIQVFLPRHAEAIDDVLVQIHKEMVEQAMRNRMETVKAVGELVANLFSPGK